jgi:mannitol/fructose-specific phosphotransferase system IIA component (Ntr-type)
MKPSDLLDAGRIVLGIDAAVPKGALIRRLTGLAVGSAANHHEEIASELIAREAKMTTGIGQGVAIPHTRTPYVDRPVAALAISREGVDFCAVDGEPVHIVFAFMTPEGDTTVHIQTLGAAASVLADEDVRRRLIAASSPSEVLDVLRSSGG